MADNKEFMKKDLSLIIQIDNKMHYNDISQVQKIRDTIISKNVFKTNLGKRYVNKLEQIIQRQNTNKCLFCGNNITNPNDTVICEVCSSKFPANPTTSNQETSKSAKETEIKDKILQNANDLVDNAKNRIHSADIKSQTQNIAKNISENKNVQHSKEYAKKMTQNVKESMNKINNDTNDNEGTSQKSTNNRKNLIVCLILLVAIIALISIIGLETIFTMATVISLGYLIYTCVKKKSKKKAIIAFVVCLLLTGIANQFSTGSNSDNVLAYLGTSEEQAFKDYDSNQFRSELNLLTNENTQTNGKPWITILNGEVADVVLDSGMNSSLNVSGIHIGDSADDVAAAMKKQDAVYDTEYSISGTLETYYYKYNGQKVQVIFTIKDGIVTRISCTLCN
ncbi:MAG: hypothetical protein MR384_03155 [Lachnospiraceae bacterium]|nr:hypothetical protein [Lachnospiraceae bacterium]